MRGLHAAGLAAVSGAGYAGGRSAAGAPRARSAELRRRGTPDLVDYKPLPVRTTPTRRIQPTSRSGRGARRHGFPGQDVHDLQAAGRRSSARRRRRTNSIPRADVPASTATFSQAAALNHFQTMNRYGWRTRTAIRRPARRVRAPPHAASRISTSSRTSTSSGLHCLEQATTPCTELPHRMRAPHGWRMSVRRRRLLRQHLLCLRGRTKSSTWQEFGQMKFKTIVSETSPTTLAPRPTAT